MIVKRQKYLNKLIDKENNGMVKVITIIRRSGKSFLLFNLFYNYLIKKGIDKNQIITLSLDEQENKKYWNIDILSKYLNKKISESNNRLYIFIDEI